MLFNAIGPVLAILLFAMMLLCLEVGRKIGKAQMQRDSDKVSASISVTEGAVFALMGLLVAFTFSGAYSRFDTRRELITQEANAIVAAYLRADLLAPAAQMVLHEDLRQYLDARLAIYKKIPDVKAVTEAFNHTKQLQLKIWNEAVAACKAEANHSAEIVLLPALNSLIDIANSRVAITKMHPPFVIFVLLIGLALFSSLLAGYSMGRSKVRRSLHMIGYAAITAFTIYITIDMEYPRVGFIRVDAFDEVLVNVKEDLR